MDTTSYKTAHISGSCGDTEQLVQEWTPPSEAFEQKHEIKDGDRGEDIIVELTHPLHSALVEMKAIFDNVIPVLMKIMDQMDFNYFVTIVNLYLYYINVFA